MELISRAEAQRLNFRFYYTGRPCANGHVARRYVSSGGCLDCANVAAGRDVAAKRASTRSPDLAELKLRAYDSDWPVLRDTAIALFRSMAPDQLPPPEKAPQGRAAGTALYTVRVPVEYAELMRDTAAEMLSAHRVDVQGRRVEILRAVCSMAEAEVDPASSK